MKRLGFCVLVAALAAATGCSTTPRQTEKPAGQAGFAPGSTAGAASQAPYVPAGGQTVQTQYRAGEVQPAGGVPRGAGGTGSYMIPGTRPATGGADCDH